MFGEFERQGYMSRHEIEEYLTLLQKKGVHFDTGTTIDETLAGTDILISDYSSMLIEFFALNRPILYCESIFEFNEDFQQMLQGMYIIRKTEDLVIRLGEIIDKGDLLAGKREKALYIMRQKNQYAVQNILDTIHQDYREAMHSAEACGSACA